MSDMGPLTSLRSRIRFTGDDSINQASDDVLLIIEETASLLASGKRALRRVDWLAREEAIAEAVRSLEALFEQD